jgi:hypothetical protein
LPGVRASPTIDARLPPPATTIRRMSPKRNPGRARDDAPDADRGSGGGGPGAAGGFNFQYAVTAIAGIRLLDGSPLGWVATAEDRPSSVRAESGGPGDDIRIETSAGVVEVQVKRGLTAGAKLRDALLPLARAIHADTIAHGVLIVCPQSSLAIRRELVEDLVHIGGGQTDSLREVSMQLLEWFEQHDLPTQPVCARLHVQTIHALDGDSESVRSAKDLLRRLCKNPDDANAAWNAIYADASRIVKSRGRWELRTLVQLLDGQNIALASSQSSADVYAALAEAARSNNAHYSLPGSRVALPIDSAWLPLRAIVVSAQPDASLSMADALALYHARPSKRDAETVDARWIGRFITRCVVVAGPGLGKSTLLTKLARLYALDGYPVLKVRLVEVAAALRNGRGILDCLIECGAPPHIADRARKAQFHDWVFLCDGLDEAYNQQEAIAAELLKLATSFPQARIVITTRPIGYVTGLLESWRHYELLPLSSDTRTHLSTLLAALLAGDDPRRGDLRSLVTETLDDERPARAIISRSPLLLGMAATALARGDSLGDTREQLYRRLLETTNTLPNPRAGNAPPARLANAVLDIAAWEVLSAPLTPADELQERCAERLAADPSYGRNRALEIVEQGLEHWESLGLIERVHAGGTKIITFVHKTFAEYAAARYLSKAEPERRRALTEACWTNSQWHEMLDFVGQMEIADVLVAQGITAGESQGARTLALALRALGADHTRVDERERRELLALAWRVVNSERSNDALDIGEALADLASRWPAEFAARAKHSINANTPWTAVVAWTCLLEAAPEACEPAAIVEAIRRFMQEGPHGISGGMFSGLVITGSGNLELVLRMAIAGTKKMLREAQSEVVRSFCDELLDILSVFADSIRSRLRRLIGQSPDHADLHGYPPRTRHFDAPSLTEYHSASKSAYARLLRAVLDAFVSTTPQSSPSASLALHLSRLLSSVKAGGPDHVDFGNWPLDQEDPSMLRALMQGAAAVRGSDTDMLVQEAAAELARLDLLESDEDYDSSLVDIDDVEPEWPRIQDTIVDATQLEYALHHPSRWVVKVATNLLAGFNAMPVDLARTLDIGHGRALAAAAVLLRRLPHETAICIATSRLKRLDGTPGLGNLFDTLATLAAPWNAELAGIVNACLMSGDTAIARAAAAFALDRLRAGAAVSGEAIVVAYRHWHEYEDPYPDGGGIIPPTPRSTLLLLLIATNRADDDLLIDAAGDQRSEIATIALSELTNRLKSQPDLCRNLVEKALTQRIPPRLLARALSAHLPLASDDIARLTTLLDAAASAWRLAATDLLDPFYLTQVDITAYAQKLSGDSAPEVRRKAERLLGKHSS